MNDVILRQLRVVVERAVRPVRASLAWKRRTREELLGHLAAIFEEEVERTGDEQAALIEAQRRFGDSRELSGQLQGSVPRRDWLARWLDFNGARPGDTLRSLAVRHLGLWAATLLTMGALMLLMLLTRDPRVGAGTLLRIGFWTATFATVMSLVFVALAAQFCHLVYFRTEGLAWARMVGYGLVSLLVFPLAAYGFHFALTADWSASLAHLGFAAWFAPAGPILFVLMARQLDGEWRRDQPWESLELDA